VKTKKISLTAEQENMKKVIPVRNVDFVCPLETDYIEDKLGEGALSGIELGRYGTYEALNFVDGRRSVLDISDALSAEFGPVDPGEVLDFFKVLERAELIAFKE
jgi:hypothetical protein